MCLLKHELFVVFSPLILLQNKLNSTVFIITRDFAKIKSSWVWTLYRDGKTRWTLNSSDTQTFRRRLFRKIILRCARARRNSVSVCKQPERRTRALRSFVLRKPVLDCCRYLDVYKISLATHSPTTRLKLYA